MVFPRIMVDSNILLDIFSTDPVWYEWSSARLEEHSETSVFVINPVIYSEISVGFRRIEELEDAIPPSYFVYEAIPREAAFLAGKCFVAYRRNGGQRLSPLPDFFIGAHALLGRMPLITRDIDRYRTYFPALKLIAPP